MLDARLTKARIEALRKAFQQRLIETMGEDDNEPKVSSTLRPLQLSS